MDTLTKERNSRFVRTPLAVALRANPRLIAILRVFDDHRLLPANWIHALVGGDRIGLNRRLTQLYREGLLNRETLLGPKNVYETMTYSRTEKGDRFLNEKGFEGLPHDGTHDAHQVLLDILSASIELGARNSSIELHKWKEIRDHPKTPKLPNHPFRFQVGTNPNNEKTIFLVPDGRPFFLKGQEGSILFVKELDRNTEPATTILTKLKNYQKAEDAIKARYGFKAMMLLFVTTDKTRQENILGWIKEVFPEGCKRRVLAGGSPAQPHQLARGHRESARARIRTREDDGPREAGEGGS